MSPSMNVHLMEALNATSVQLNRYFSLFIFIFGFTGNILNILVLTQRSIRSNPCVFLFLMSSIANLISIISGLTTRILSSWQIDFTETNDIFFLIMLATYERWIMSSSNLQHRQLSSIKNDRKGSLIVTLISIVIYLQMLYRYKANLMDAPLKCYGKTSACHLLTDIIYSCLTILFPLISMTVLGVLTLSNIRKTRTCMEPRKIRREERLNEKCLIIQQRQRQRWKKIDRYLRRMLLLQVISLILLTFPQAIHKVYFTMLSNKNKSQLQYDFDRFLYNFELLLLFIESALPFYIYTLAGGKVFRNALEKLLF
ncbi:unnamed protein product [Rotaria magnacalcarata]|uniref:G-protein coupled receptors family 1 profile domain-containing protein n=1 Tax=Rotaria magnacalcarata TaxID=392030 RepID=A0A820HLJ7_9BILA|nr:unnamed protein product [Rotaria magnacalcarata]